MATVIGQVKEFDGGKEDWPQYVKRLEQFFIANGIEEGKKRAVLLMAMGPATFKLLRSLIAPDKPDTKSCANLVKVLTEHFQPTPSETVQRFKFHGRTRQPGESVATYVSELHAIAKHCNFGASLQAMLRDQIVCGISGKVVQRRLLSESALSFDKALSMAQGLETAAQSVKELQGGAGATSQREVHRVTSQQAFQNKGKPDRLKGNSASACYRCGKSGHGASQCRFKSAECHRCGKKGHICVVCHSKPKPAGRSHSVQQVHETGEDEGDEHPLYHLSSKKAAPYKVEVRVDNCLIEMEIDTGAGLSLVLEATFRKTWTDRSMEPSKVRLCS